MYNKIKIYILLNLLFFPEKGFCYIDPGSLSAIWQFLAAILIGIVTGFSFIRIKIKMFFNKIFLRNDKEKMTK